MPTALLQSAKAATVVKVTQAASNGWAFMQEVATGSGAFVVGPTTPPLGTGSAQLTVDSTGREGLWTLNFAGTRLDQIETLSYSTYQPASTSNPAWATALQLDMDYDLTDNNTSWQGRLVYEPYLSGTAITHGAWQTWDARAGKWWASGAPGNTNCPQASPCTYAQVLSNWPNAGLRPTVGILQFKAGGPWTGGFTGNVDNFTIKIAGNETTYDFEPIVPCTTTCYVDGTNGNDLNGGTSETDAKKTIQAAVNQVSANGTVIVAAGTYDEKVTINKNDLTIQGASTGTTILKNVTAPGTGTGIAFVGARNGITLKQFTVTDYQDGISMPTGPLTNTLIEDVAAVRNARHGIFSQAFGIDGLTVRRVTASENNSTGTSQNGRGIWIINGIKQNITIEDSTFNNNRLTGIDVSDGNVTGLMIVRNTVSGNGDAGISVLGPQGPGANLVDGNTVTDNGRYGIEVKMPNGSGASSGPGSVVVSHNVVKRTVEATDARDYAGIAVIRRSGNATYNADQPVGVVVSENEVSGYHRKPTGSTGDGFGIVVEGTNNTITKNSVTDNDIGIQVQGGNTANVQSTPFFDRGDAAEGGAVVQLNSITGNSIGARAVGDAAVTEFDAMHNWWGNVTGPTSPDNTGGTGDSAVGVTAFVPWLCNGVDTSAAVGFQPNETVCGVATRLVFSTEPGGAKVGQPLDPQPVVRVEDDAGQLMTSFNGPITITLGTNPGSATLSGTLTVTATNGVATFTKLSINQSGTGYTLVATAAGLTQATSAPFDVSGVATRLVFGTQPGGAKVGQPLNPQPVVYVQDDNGVLVSSFNGPIAITLGANPGGATLSGTLTVTATNGVATFTNLSINQSGTGYTLVATAAGLTQATSAPFDITEVKEPVPSYPLYLPLIMRS
jgi:hypothetical protein